MSERRCSVVDAQTADAKMLQVDEDRSTKAVEERLEFGWLQFDEVLLEFAADQSLLSENVAPRFIGQAQSGNSEMVHIKAQLSRDGSQPDHLLQIQIDHNPSEHFER